jgi:hypothetical protein
MLPARKTKIKETLSQGLPTSNNVYCTGVHKKRQLVLQKQVIEIELLKISPVQFWVVPPIILLPLKNPLSGKARASTSDNE